MKFGKTEKELVASAVSSFIRFLDVSGFEDKKYIDEVRSLHLKILRNSDWSYIFWNMPGNEFAGKIKVRLSSFPDIKRKSAWKLYANGRLKLSSIIFSKLICLPDKAEKITRKSNERFTISFKDFEEIDIEADSGAAEALSKLSILLENDAFLARTIPSMIIMDSIAYAVSSHQSSAFADNRQKLNEILHRLSNAFYGITPKIISQKQELQPSLHSNSGKVKIEIGEEALVLLYSILNEYCEMKENTSQCNDKEKLSTAKKLREIFRKSNEE